MIRIWFWARPLVPSLGAAPVRENWFWLAFILRTSCQPWMSLASATFCRFFAALAQRRATDFFLLRAFHSQPVEQRALGLLLGGGDFDQFLIRATR